MNEKYTYHYSSKLNLKDIHHHIFFLCSNQNDLKRVQRDFGLTDIPEKIFEDFQGVVGQDVSYYQNDKRYQFIGYGAKNQCNPDLLYEISMKVGKSIPNENIMVHLIEDSDLLSIHHQVSGFILGSYSFDALKSSEKKKIQNKKRKIQNKRERGSSKQNIYFYHPDKSFERDIQNYIQISQIQNEIRNYINLPSNILRISEYIRYMKKGCPKNLKMRIISASELERLGMNLILGVNQGSNQKSALVIFEYASSKEEKKKAPVCMIGKGVMFDSGGYSLKMGPSMEKMKYDMTASAIVYGVMKSHALLKSKGHYIGLLPLVENMIGQNAIRPSDVIRSYSGKTVEITNTDAEGRLIIADCLSYCERYKPKCLIDLGTLSGEAVRIFNSKSSVVMGNHFQYNRQIIEFGNLFHERIWELPMWDVYLDDLRSDVADLRNTGKSGQAGTIIIGAFLSNFVPLNPKTQQPYPWIHLDIAGVDHASGSPYLRDGAKGEPMKTLLTFTRSI